MTDVTDKYQLWSHNIYIKNIWTDCKTETMCPWKWFARHLLIWKLPSWQEGLLYSWVSAPIYIRIYKRNLKQVAIFADNSAAHICQSPDCRPNYDLVKNIYHPGGRKHSQSVGPTICIPRNQSGFPSNFVLFVLQSEMISSVEDVCRIYSCIHDIQRWISDNSKQLSY